MQSIFVPRDTDPEEVRTALSPATAAKLVEAGVKVRLESGIGAGAGWPDAVYEKAGAEVVADAATGLGGAEVVFTLTAPSGDRLKRCGPGSKVIGFFDPFNNRSYLDTLAESGVEAFCLELMPRSTIAQKMDVLSSQSNLAGYAAVILGARELNKIFPMMMTPAGTLQPSTVFVLGVGVAGLQAIATAKRLGARVEAFDTRPVVEEQVKSLGGRFLKIDLGQSGQTDQGYAEALTPEQLQLQREGVAKACARADLVITTAKLFGRPAPRLVDQAALDRMRPGSVVVDLAVETGGNVEGSAVGQTKVTASGVKMLGPRKAEWEYPQAASEMLAANYLHFFNHCREKAAEADADPILTGTRLVAGGKVVHPDFVESPAS